eukprot:jgi/Ulvmu1/5658/UM024_0005.1
MLQNQGTQHGSRAPQRTQRFTGVPSTASAASQTRRAAQEQPLAIRVIHMHMIQFMYAAAWMWIEHFDDLLHVCHDEYPQARLRHVRRHTRRHTAHTTHHIPLLFIGTHADL